MAHKKVEEAVVNVAHEVKPHYDKMKAEGASDEVIRQFMIDSLDLTARQIIFEPDTALKIILDAPFAFNIVYRFSQYMGGVNGVLAEGDIAPIHISEIKALEETLIEPMEQVAEKKIDEILAEMEETEERMLRNGEFDEE